MHRGFVTYEDGVRSFRCNVEDIDLLNLIMMMLGCSQRRREVILIPNATLCAALSSKAAQGIH